MRSLCLAFALVFGISFAAVAADGPKTPQIVQPASTADPIRMMSMLMPGQGPEPRFCGQCSDDSHCGTGFKCCGPSSCLECFRVDTCP